MTPQSDEWFTPMGIVAVVRAALGGTIDLDPFSTAAANQIVTAGQFLSVEDDAFAVTWPRVDTVFMNPPYSRGRCPAAVDRFLGQYQRGRFRRGVVLVNNATETVWFQELLRHSSAVCLPRFRVQFWNTDGKNVSTNPRGQALLYVDAQRDASLFLAHMPPLGSVLLPSGRPVDVTASH